MAEYHVGCGAFAIYAGTLNSKNRSLWQNKSECTDEALCAVRDYMVSELLGGTDCSKATSSGYEWTLKDGRTVELRVTVKEPFVPEKMFGIEYVQGYTAALQDVLKVLDEIPRDLKLHHRKQNISTLKAIVSCMIKNRTILREEPYAFVRCNDNVDGGFEVYIERKGVHK